jgi:hypothetical protein
MLAVASSAIILGFSVSVDPGAQRMAEAQGVDIRNYDIRMTKDMGFNGARKHQKLEDPRYLYWADRMGLLVSSEMANAYVFDGDYVSRFTREWLAAVARDRNHPSIIIWAPINESWGTPNLDDPRQLGLRYAETPAQICVPSAAEIVGEAARRDYQERVQLLIDAIPWTRAA